MASRNKLEKTNRRKRPTGGDWMKGGLKLKLKRAAFYNPSMRMELKKNTQKEVDEAIVEIYDSLGNDNPELALTQLQNLMESVD